MLLTWEKLLNNVRRKELHGSAESMGTRGGRTECERDYDRILFATPTRRLADKTQVFPMEVNDSVRTRLTHSHEVSNLARSIGVRLAFEHASAVFGPDHEELQVKKGYASFYDLMDFIQSSGGGDAVSMDVVQAARRKNTEFKKEQLSSRELNDLSMQMFRVKAISAMVQAATETFVENIGTIMAGRIEPGFELIKSSDCAQLCKVVKEFARRHGFQHKEVLRLELSGNRYIKSMMSMLWRAIERGDDPDHPFERFVFGEISENYRRVYGSAQGSKYARCQLLCDVLSGMTESHLIQKHAEFSSLANAAA